jgi:hypothetical protein
MRVLKRIARVAVKREGIHTNHEGSQSMVKDRQIIVRLLGEL